MVEVASVYSQFFKFTSFKNVSLIRTLGTKFLKTIPLIQKMHQMVVRLFCLMA